MPSPFVRKLEYGAVLTDADRRVLEGACGISKRVAARSELIGEGDEPRNVHLVQDGFACRYKILGDGKRQIVAFFVPGDICDLHIHILGEMDHAIGTLAESTIVEFPPETIAALIANPRINRALWWSTLVDEGTLREWLVNMGQRPAEQQMAHLFCEVMVRLHAVEMALDDCFTMTFTQEELGDTLGITPVHANRVLTQLRRRDLIRTNGRSLSIPDLQRLKDFCDFSSRYLHLKRKHDIASSLVREAVPD